MKLVLSTRLEAALPLCAEAVMRPALLQAVAAPLVRFTPVQGEWPSRWMPGPFLVKLHLFGWLPLGEQVIGIELPPSSAQRFELLDLGHSPLIPKWHHRITLETDDAGTRYTDALDLDAGWRTPLVWAFAWLFYRHRQRRWRQLVATSALPALLNVT